MDADAFLNGGFTASGPVRLLRARFRGDLYVGGSNAQGVEPLRLVLERARIDGTLLLRAGWPARGEMNLAHARVGILADEPDAWPEQGRLCLDGLVCDALGAEDRTPRDARRRLAWLRRQREFQPQPYEQLAQVLAAMGQVEQAKRVLIGMARDRHGQERPRSIRAVGSALRWLWRWVRWAVLGYGYRPWRAMGWPVVLWAAGWAVFWQAQLREQMEQVGAPGNGMRTMVAPAYSLDVMLLIIELHQEAYWLPRSGTWQRWYFWIHKPMGWVLVTFLFAGVAGLVRPEPVTRPAGGDQPR